MALLVATPSPATDLDPNWVHRLAVGQPASPAPMQRCDDSRSGRTRTRLPRAPVPLGKARAPGALAFAPVVDDAGRLVAVTQAGRVVQLTLAGRIEWTHHLGAPPAGPPVLANDEHRVVLGTDGTLVRLAVDGRQALAVRLPFPIVERAAPALPMFDGGVLVAHPDRIGWYDVEGSLRAEGKLHGSVTALIGGRNATLAVTEHGAVYSWQPGQQPNRVGDLRGQVGEAVAVDRDRLVAVVDGREVRELNLRSGVLNTLIGRSAMRLGADLVLLDGIAVVASTGGLALGVDRKGHEAFRLALWTQAPTSIRATNRAPLLGDVRGSLAFATPTGAVAVTSPNAETQSAAAEGCIDPLAIVPIRDGVFALACRSGLVSYFGAKGHPAIDARP